MAKITYENKVALNVNSDIADINKCNASDLNEIKNVVNTNDDNTNNNSNAIGTLSSLNTTNKSNLVSAINEVNNKFNYSTSEQVIGKWIDGKPLYRKVIQFTTTIQGESLFSMSHNISNADYIYVEKFYMSNQNAICYEVPLIGYAGNTTDKAYSYIDRNNLYVYSTGGWNTAWVKKVIIEYTKTTD